MAFTVAKRDLSGYRISAEEHAALQQLIDQAVAAANSGNLAFAATDPDTKVSIEVQLHHGRHHYIHLRRDDWGRPFTLTTIELKKV